MTMKECLQRLSELVSDLCWEAEQAQSRDEHDEADRLWSIAGKIEDCLPKNRKDRTP